MKRPPHAQVAVPLPLPGPLTYAIPEGLSPRVEPGVRVRVGVGRRRLTGVVLARTAEAPAGVELRPLEAVLDARPTLTPELLELARFAARYYFAPLGEVLRSMLPADLPAWGDRRLALTDAGALAAPRDGGEEAVVEALRAAGRLSQSELQGRVALPDLDAVVERLLAAGRLTTRDRRRGGARYSTAVELPAGDLDARRAACGRSPQGRAVVDYLAALGRPAGLEEVAAAVGCGPGVVRRLVSRGVLRRFTQIEKLDLERHLLSGGEGEERLVLRPDQEAAVAALVAALERREFAPFLLRGVTGSGKTEVYLRAAERVLAQGRGAILLVPEIALVPALARAVQRRFGERLAILHSNLGGAERRQEWERVRDGEARLVLGPRSAVFAPLADVGLIVVDEEQAPAYKQDSTPRYHGRDLALVRGRDAGATVALISATPSLESRYNVQAGKYTGLALTTRAGAGRLPEGMVVDLRREVAQRRPGEARFSGVLREEIRQALAAGGQVILLRNRRGYAPILLCRACGEDMRCDDCGLPRTYHRRDRRLLCHYCGSRLPVPRSCPSCGAEALEAVGTGTERVEEEFAELFPDVPVDVLDADAVRRPGGAAAVLEGFASGATRVLIGTQMVSKGHHFPDVALAAVLSADTYLGFPDFRAVERTYNLLTQLAGRAGRGERPGKVVIQTYHPDHYAIRAVIDNDDAAFAAEEMRFRRVFHYPPFTRMVQILAQHRNREKAESIVRDLSERLEAHPLRRQARVSGPAPAPLERLRGRWRFQLLVRAAEGRHLGQLLRAVLPENPGTELIVDIDPQDLL